LLFDRRAATFKNTVCHEFPYLYREEFSSGMKNQPYHTIETGYCTSAIAKSISGIGNGASGSMFPPHARARLLTRAP